jgi:tetraacyldisaccharide 4'-kinase
LRSRLIYYLYWFLQALALPFILGYFLYRGLRDTPYFRQFHQRFGFLPHPFKRTAHGSIWLHGVSVGEVLSSMELLRRLKQEMPYAPLFVSCTTIAGKAIAEQKLAGIADGVFFAPIDLRMAVRGVLRTIRPQLVIVMETEIWPNLYREAKRSGAGLVVVNGRISNRAVPKYERLRWFFCEILCWPDAILVQSEKDRARYLMLGARPEKVVSAGNLKYDIKANEAEAPQAVRELLSQVEPAPVWVAASTTAPARTGDVDEEEAVLDAFTSLAPEFPRLLLILVPRKPERFDEVAGKLDARRIPYVRRSRLPGPLPLPGVLLLDSMGELGSLFDFADAVFMGGTLADRGGHNILEPAMVSRAVVAGPHMENFAEIADDFTRGGGLLRIPDSSALAAAMRELFLDPALRRSLGDRARQLTEARQGATYKALEQCWISYAYAVPHVPPFGLLFPLQWALSHLWKWGGRWNMRTAQPRSLRVPVVSVGGIVMGGAGKTPSVIWLSEVLRDRGRNPAILTRGYKRRSPEKTVILEPGAKAPVEVTGDEAQILLRAGTAPVGIGGDRHEAGSQMEAQFRPGVFILDDGFQHWRLERQIDLVMIDALDPFGGAGLFPKGRLREPLDALTRADAFVLTRTQTGRRYDGIEARLRQYNADAPVFRSRVVPRRWIDASSGRGYAPDKLPARRVAAFCGLANPASFWLTLEQLSYRPAYKWAFGDHHHYTIAEIRTLAAQAQAHRAEALLTTEKDLMNLPPEALALIAPMPLFWLEIRIEFENEQAIVEWIEKRLPRAEEAFP